MATSRGRSLSHQSYNSREFSVFLTTSSVLYQKRIEYQNSNPSLSKQVKTEVISLAIPSNLEQRTNTDIQISNNNLPVKSQCVINKAPALNNTLSMYVEHEIIVLVEINTQFTYYKVSLSYNINQPTEPNSWDGEAYSISIFGSMKFIKTDAKNTTPLCYAWLILSDLERLTLV